MEETVKRKRGRRKKLVNYESLTLPHKESKHKIFLHLTLSDADVIEEEKDHVTPSLVYEPRVPIIEPMMPASDMNTFETTKLQIVPSTHVVYNHQNDTCLKEQDFLLTIKEKEPRRSTKVIYDNLQEIIDSQPTNLQCWHCTLSFPGNPFFLPLRSLHPTRFKPGRLDTMGCFCSVSCSLAYAKERHLHKQTSLLQQLYPLDKLHPSPPKEVLQRYGGPLSDDEYRDALKSLGTLRIFITRSPEVHIIEQTIVETRGQETFEVNTRPKTKARIIDKKMLHQAHEHHTIQKDKPTTALLIEEELLL